MSISHSQLERLNFIHANPALKKHHFQQQILKTCKLHEKHDRQTEHRLSSR